jgi:tight adherence protein C
MLNKNNLNIKNLQEGADFLDFILLNLEAGANIQQSFFQAAQNLDSGVFKKQAQKINGFCQIGFSFAESLHSGLQNESINPVLKEILENLALSLKLGTPLIQILSHLSFHFRVTASSRLEEIGNKAPVKMIFPLVLFIFPAIFILLGSGAIESLLHSFNF